MHESKHFLQGQFVHSDYSVEIQTTTYIKMRTLDTPTAA
jgi:hypothetical protein